MNVTRNNEIFDVCDFPDDDGWFWDRFSDGTWEPESFEAIDAHITPGSTFVDIGAWIGPLSLWAARKGAHVLAIEPDPVARHVLLENVMLNDLLDRVTVLSFAVSDQTGIGFLKHRGHDLEPGELGNSMSGLSDHGVEVPTITIPDLWDMYDIRDVGLVKIDIEGGEAALVGDAPFLRQFPLLLSTHGEWMTSADQSAVGAAFGVNAAGFSNVLLAAA